MHNSRHLFFKIVLTFILSTVAAAHHPHKSLAQTTPAPLITEVFPAPTVGPEWIELYNPGQTSLDLTGWVLEDHLTNPSVIATLPSITIQPSEYLVVELQSQKLNNNADGVTLKNNTDQIIDTMDYSSSQSDMSWSRTATQPSASFVLTAPSPGSPALFPSPTPPTSPSPAPATTPTPTPFTATPTNISLTQIMACPETGSPEWVEIYNAHNYTATLTNWSLKDESGNTRSVNGTVTPNGHLKIEWQSSFLNNSGDSVYLLNNFGTTIASATYTQCNSGITLTLQDGEWKPSQPSETEDSDSTKDSTSTTVTNQDSGKTTDAKNTTQNSISRRFGAPPTFPWLKLLQLPSITSDTSTSDEIIASKDFQPEETASPATSRTVTTSPSPTTSQSPTSPFDPSNLPAHGAIIGGLLVSSGSSLFVHQYRKQLQLQPESSIP